MNRKSSSKMFDDYPEIKQTDIDKAKFRIGLKETAKKRRISIMLDTSIIEWFKQKAGLKGYQTMINNALKQMIETESIETLIRRVVREELGKA